MRYRIKATAVVRDGMLFEESVPVVFHLECSKDMDAYIKAKNVIRNAEVGWSDFVVTDDEGNEVGFFKFRRK